MGLHFLGGQLLFSGGELAMSDDCCCGGEDVCLSGNAALWKVNLTVSFESCETPPATYNNPSLLDLTIELPYVTGLLNSGAIYRQTILGPSTKYGCRADNGYWTTAAYGVVLKCDPTTYSISLTMGTTNTALSTAFNFTYANINGAGAIQSETAYILTPNSTDPLSGLDIPSIPTSCTVTVLPV